MNAEFNWWLLIVGLVVGAGLVWLVIADWSRREEDLALDERAAESAWIADALRGRGEPLDPATADEILELHRAYLRQTAGFEPADDVDAFDADDEADDSSVTEDGTESDWPGAAGDDPEASEEPAGDDPEADAEPAGAAADPQDAPTTGEVAPVQVSRPSVRSDPLSPRGGHASEPGAESPVS